MGPFGSTAAAKAASSQGNAICHGTFTLSLSVCVCVAHNIPTRLPGYNCIEVPLPISAPMLPILDPDDPDPRRMLRNCMDRSMATISRLSAASPAEIRAIHERLSERDRSLLAGLYGKTAAVTLGASGVSLFLTSAIGPRTAVSAILGGITAGAVGAATAVAAVATRTPDVLLEAARTGGPSALADEIVCLDAEHRSACSVALERTRTEARSAAFAVLGSPLIKICTRGGTHLTQVRATFW